ncbi:hypothetical protein [Nitrospira sp. BLG_2]|uniref:hypothetical protein n=1 Tax=Nitrospira sp. BLG_2 TaxID=3397507 RepID=UPI003B9AB608
MFSVVIHKNYKELRRSKGMQFEKALDICRQINRFNQDHTWNAENAYVEEAHTVKHLPIGEDLNA